MYTIIACCLITMKNSPPPSKILTWLWLIHPELPRLVKQCYGTELGTCTLTHSWSLNGLFGSSSRRDNLPGFKYDFAILLWEKFTFTQIMTVAGAASFLTQWTGPVKWPLFQGSPAGGMGDRLMCNWDQAKEVALHMILASSADFILSKRELRVCEISGLIRDNALPWWTLDA